MEVGQTVDVHLMPEEAYGMPDPDAVFTLEIAQLPGSENLRSGSRCTSQPVWSAVPGQGDSEGRDNDHVRRQP